MTEEQVRAELESLGLCVEVDQYAALLCYVEALARWGPTHNLTAIFQGDEVWKVHLLDSLAALPSARREMQARGWSTPRCRKLARCRCWMWALAPDYPACLGP